MNDIAHKKMVQDMLSKRFGSHKRLKCKYRMKYPEQAQREYQRVSGAYMRVLNRIVKKHLPEIRDAAAEERQSSKMRMDDTQDLLSKLSQIFDRIAEELEQEMGLFGLREKLEGLANLTKKLSISEWKKAVKSTLGIDLFDDYYSGEMYRQMLSKWVDDNVGLIKTIPQESLERMRHIVMEGYTSGKTTTDIVKEMQEEYGVSKRHARLLARDQMAKLNANITKSQQEDAGVKEYIWSTSGDSRVRESHAELDGKRFRWDDPPIVDYKTGRRCHPGEDFQCRCCALPVFEWETIDVPVAERGGALD